MLGFDKKLELTEKAKSKMKADKQIIFIFSKTIFINWWFYYYKDLKLIFIFFLNIINYINFEFDINKSGVFQIFSKLFLNK